MPDYALDYLEQQWARDEEISAIRAAIDNYHKTGFLSKEQRDEQREVLTDLLKRGCGIPALRRNFARMAPKGEATLRHLDEGRTIVPSRHQVGKIDWLCNQRVNLLGYVGDTISAEVQSFKAPFTDDLYVFLDGDDYVIAILDHKQWQDPYPGAPWPPGSYYVLYLEPGWDPSEHKGNLPQLDDWRVRTLKPFQPYRKAGTYDLAEYVRAEHRGSQLQLKRARLLLRMCEVINADFPVDF